MVVERNGIKNEIYRKSYTNYIFKYNINIISNSMFTNIWMVRYRNSTRISKRLLLFGTSSKIILGVSIVFILLSLRCIFFDPTSKQEQKDKQGILLANDNGKLMISKDTIEDLVEAVTKQYKMAKDVTSRVELDKENNVNIFVNLVVSSDTVIKDLSADLQEKIKNKVKETTDLEVKEVNIIVKKAVQEKQPKSVSQDI